MIGTNGSQSALEQALDRLNREIRDGLKHGFFDLTVACEMVRGGKRRLIIKAGKSHIYTISENELG